MAYQFQPTFTIRVAFEGENQFLTLPEEDIEKAIKALAKDKKLVKMMASHASKFRGKKWLSNDEEEISERKQIFPMIEKTLGEFGDRFLPFSTAISEELFHRIEEGFISE